MHRIIQSEIVLLLGDLIIDFSVLRAQCSVVSQCLWPARLLCPWNFPEQNTGGLPFPPLGELPDLGIAPVFPESPALAGRFFTTAAAGKPVYMSQWLIDQAKYRRSERNN